ncbi:MAG TPA: DUF4097 family beta strand repeat-containing protein [Patescibacteria group bacterium]|nr:DUF4097 family beta strand repeat-containing protein [Patescibacteria group bacterium]
MKNWRALSFGVFLITLGIGWYIFSSIQVSFETFAWILLIAGIALIMIPLVSWKRPAWPARGLVVAVVGGLLISLLFSGGFALVQNFTGGTFWFNTAQGTKSYNGTTTAINIYMQIDNFNGPIRVSTWDVSRYSIDLTIRAGGSSQVNADNKLAALNVTLNDTTSAGVENLILMYNVPSSDHSSYTIEVDALLPSNAILKLDLHSSNGGIYLTNINGTTVNAETTNGPLTFDGVHVNNLTAQTSNGRVDGTLEATNTVIRTSNGMIMLTIPSTTTGNIDLSTSNGPIELHVSNPTQAGYNLDASTSNGNINFNLPNLNYSVDQKTAKKAKTIGFNSKTIQVTIQAATSNGNIDIDTP